MGEETKQDNEAPTETKAEEKVVEEKKEENTPPPPPAQPEDEKPPAEEENKAEEQPPPPPPPPPPFIINVDLHCPGCAKKIERYIMKIRGVEGVVTDMAQNQVTIKGVVEPQAVCNIIMKKTKRSAKVISPLPATEGEPIPDVVTSQVSGLTTVELIVNMHCEACAGQLKKKILKLRGVQTAETELGSSKVTVTGTMDANTLVDYVYKRTKKQARIVPQPEPAPENPPEEPKPEEATEPEKPVEEPTKAEEKSEEIGDQQKDEKPAEEAPKEGGGDTKEGGNDGVDSGMVEEEPMKRMMMHNYNYNYNPNNYYEYTSNYYQRPYYVIDRIPPPQLFSDENPNACCIS